MELITNGLWDIVNETAPIEEAVTRAKFAARCDKRPACYYLLYWRESSLLYLTGTDPIDMVQFLRTCNFIAKCALRFKIIVDRSPCPVIASNYTCVLAPRYLQPRDIRWLTSAGLIKLCRVVEQCMALHNRYILLCFDVSLNASSSSYQFNLQVYVNCLYLFGRH